MNKRRKKRKLRRMAIIILPIILLISLALFMKNIGTDEQEPETQEALGPIEIIIKEPAPITATILSAGDIIMHDPFLTSNRYLKADGTYDYNSIFTYIKDEYGAADFTVLNLESTISDGNYKGYPRFRAPAAITTAFSQNYVDMCLLANNHIYDNYDAGMTMTMNALESNSLLYIGARKTVSEKTYLIQEINGIKVGFFNYTYDTGSVNGQKISINYIPVSNESAPLINTFNYSNLQSLYNSIKTGLEEMKAAGVEYTIAYIHWGSEYQTTENSTQRQIATQLCELGIDALIGGHSHCIQPVDLLTNSTGDHQMICAYSLGNHLSNQYQERMDSMPTGHTEDGLMVKLVLERTADDVVSLAEAEFIPTWVYTSPDVATNSNPEYYIMPLNNPEKLLQEAASLDIANDIQKSLERTNAIIGAGVEKVQNALK